MSGRYPFAALLAALGCDEQTVKARLGLDYRQVARYMAQGLTEKRADELATAAGLVHLEVWPDVVADCWVECASTGCPVLFVPRDAKGHQLYCSATCRHRERARRYRATEAGKAAARRANRTYYSDPKVRERQAADRKDPRYRRAETAAQRLRRAAKREAA